MSTCALFVVAPICKAASPSSSVPAVPEKSGRCAPPRPATKLNLRDASELDAELRRFSAVVYSDSDVLPKQVDLVRERRGDLRYAIERYHGGFRAFRAISSQRTRAPRTSQPKLEAFNKLDSQIRLFIEEYVVPLDPAYATIARLYFPTHAALRLSGRSDLVRAVREFGGSRAVARRMGLHLHYHATTDYAGEYARFVAEMRRFISEAQRELAYGVLFDKDDVSEKTASVPMPTAAQLHDAGRIDLIAGVRVHGGSAKVASLLGLKLQRGRRTSTSRASITGSGENKTNRTAESARVRTMLDETFFQVECCTDAVALFHNNGNRLRRDAKDEPRGGAGGALLPREGGRRRTHYHFQDFQVVESELAGFIFDDGTPGVMPTAKELIRAGRRDLVRAMQMHGGQKNVAARLGLVRRSMGRKKVLTATGVDS